MARVWGPVTARIEAFAVSSAGRAIGSSAVAVAVFCDAGADRRGGDAGGDLATAVAPGASVPSWHVTV